MVALDAYTLSKRRCGEPMSSARPIEVARLDTEQAERISEALALQKTKGSAAAALYMEAHGVGPGTTLRVLFTLRCRRAKPALGNELRDNSPVCPSE